MENGRLSFERDGRDWPNRDASQFVHAAGLRWHVQVMGQGPCLLLLHGTGASTHSWRDMAPILARDFTLVMPDLPGHGFTAPIESARLSLPGIARAVAGLLKTLGLEPQAVAGHSAGAAILARMCIDRTIAPVGLVSLNGAFFPFEGLAGLLFPPMAKLMFLNPLTPRVLAWSADLTSVSRLIAGTGSRLDRFGLELYARLMANPAHIAGTLGMMANWDLDGLAKGMGRLKLPVRLIVGLADRSVPPVSAGQLAATLNDAQVEKMPGLGHLAHEEAPERVAPLITEFFMQHGLPTNPCDATSPENCA
jgi:magnesium chelatase accessory protein